ncbi:AfsR/SARP family transcriptional regulator [Pseudonocardia spinosispora]|uniref:AfsR/SARP family transcriptional regulator n=1 Tax=Pseudonocardia spinosispora TaxID=103441 RepID=UPI000414EF15|nr:BTAD domain-containing putative transcriptional regulator [Pseudonocardia spinosispora]
MDDIDTRLAGLRYRILGPVAVVDDRGEPIRLGAPKQRALLATLLLHANHAVSEERLIALVWGEDPPRTVRGRVQVYVSELRAALGQEVISRAGDGYQLTVAPGQLDLDLFHALRREAAADPDRATRLLRSALGLWTGIPLGGLGDALVVTERPGLDELRLTAWEELFAAELAQGRAVHVVGELRTAAAEHPFRERIVAQLMTALHRCDRRSEALAVYAETHRRLVDELGIEPGQRLRDVQAMVLNDESEQQQRPAPAELPRDVRGFSGRSDELTELDARLSSGGVGVISGTAGIGKTALAVHWAHRVRADFPDGQLYLNLRGFDPEHEPLTSDAALGQLLRSLGADPRQLPDTSEGQTALYRSLLADRQVLLVLDNARDAGQVLPLLPPSGSVVVTSRHRLSELVSSVGANVVLLDALGSDDTHTLLEAVLGERRVAAEASAAARLGELCGGLPLALRVVAARLATEPGTTIADAVAELEGANPLDALVLDDEQPGIVAVAFGATYRTLSEPGRRLFRLLGLVPGADFTASTTAALLDVSLPEAGRWLSTLATVHLVERHASRRYRFHDLVRAYAARLASADPDRDAAWARLVEHYLDIAEAGTRLHGASTVQLPADSALALARRVRRRPAGTVALVPHDPDVEMSNLATALSHAARRGPYPAAWLLAEDLLSYFHRFGRRAEWMDIAPAILGAAVIHDEVHLQALLHRGIGDSLFRAGQRDAGMRHLHDAVRLAHELGWKDCEAAALDNLGTALEWTGRLPEAAEHTLEAARLFAELGSVTGENRTLNALGGKYHHLGRLRESEQSYLRALALSEAHDLPMRRASDLMDLGSVQLELGRHDDAERSLVRARDLFTELRSPMGLIFTYFWLSRLRWQTGDDQLAREEAERGLVLAKASGAKLVEAATLNALSEAEIRLGLLDRAAEHLAESLRIVRTGGFGFHLGYALCARARLHAALGELEQAVETAIQARQVARDGGYRPPEIAASLVLTEIYTRWGKPEPAREHGLETLRLCEETGQANEAIRVRRLLGS